MFAELLLRLDRAPRPGYVYPDPRGGPSDVEASLGERGEEHRLMADWVGALRGGLALDAGCGLGAHTRWLRDRFTHVLSVDGDPARLGTARAAWGESANHVFRCVQLEEDVLREPAFQGRFGFVQCMQVLGHMSVTSQARALANLAGLLDGEAPLLLAVPFTTAMADQFCKTLLTPSGMSDGIPIAVGEFEALTRGATPGVLPVHHFSVAGLQRLVRGAGLTIRRMQAYNHVGPERADAMLLCGRV